jgi:dTDP-4-amino-4,6-dideoxygalactose transaminase
MEQTNSKLNSSKIPLSHNHFDTLALNNELQYWEGRSHEEILEGFEAKLCEITKSPYAVALSSGTAALHLALKASGVNKGDQVPVSTFTYVGSVNPICYLDAQPVFIDSEKETWNMDPNVLEDSLKNLSANGNRPRAIEVVHSYGMPAMMNEIMELAARFEVPLIEDAASGIGGNHHGRALGTIGDIGVLSFNNNKTITAFGGGALLTKSEEIYKRVKFMASQARENKPFYEFNEVGYNYKMGPLNAVYGLSQLKKLNEKINARRSAYDRYAIALNTIDEITLQVEPKDFFSSRWLTALLIEADKNPVVSNERIRKELGDHGMESRYLWKPMHMQPVFKDAQYVGGAVSEALFKNGLCLPSGPELSQEDIDRIVAIVKGAVP